MASKQTESTDRWMERNGMTQMNTAVPRAQLDAFDAAAKALGMSRRQAILMLMDGLTKSVGSSKSMIKNASGPVTANVTLQT